MLGTNNVRAKLNEMPRKVQCKLTANGSDITNVKMLTYSSDWTGNITVGQVVSSYINVTIPTESNLAGANVTLNMGIDNPVEWTQIGVFRIDEESVRTKQGYTSFSAYDKLRYANNTYHPTEVYSGHSTALSYPVTLKQICDDVCGLIGITSIASLPVNPQFTADSDILNIIDGYTLRDVLGFIAAYCGRNAYLSPSGQLELRWFSASGYTAGDTKANIPYIGEKNCTVSRLICQTANGTITSGSGEGIYFICPFMDSTRLSNMVSGLSLTYRKAEVDIPFGNFCLQAGDIITVDTDQLNLSVPIMDNSWTFDGGLSSAVTSYGVSDYQGTANNAQLSLSATRVQRQLAVNRAASDLKIASEKITGASGGYIRINFGGDGKTAALLIMDTEDISTAQNVWVFNQEGLGHFPNGYDPTAQANVALTADGWVAASRISGEMISGVGIENVDRALTTQPKIALSNGCIHFTETYDYSGTSPQVTDIGKLEYLPRSGQNNPATIALTCQNGNKITIGEYGYPKYVYNSNPTGTETTHTFYDNVKFYNDVYIGDSLLSTENIVKSVDSGAKNLLKNYIEYVHQWNTWGTWNNNTWTITAGGANITITFWADNSLTVSGTSGTANIYISYGALNLVNGKRYTLSGCPAGGGTTKYALYTGTWYAWDCYGEPNTVEYNSSTMGAMYIFLAKNQTFNNLVFKPMICTEDDWKVSQAYQPWRPTYQELYERVILLEQRVTALENQ